MVRGGEGGGSGGGGWPWAPSRRPPEPLPLSRTPSSPHTLARLAAQTFALFLLFGPCLTYCLIRFQVVTADKYDKLANPYSNQPKTLV